jgi:hypothetical protein
MNKHKLVKKLTVKLETLHQLSSEQTPQAVGGCGPNTYTYYNHCTRTCS